MADEQPPTPSSSCSCPAKKSIHVHCICQGCKGKAVNYRTQLLHLSCEPKEKRMRQDNDHVASSSSSLLTADDPPGTATDCQNDISDTADVEDHDEDNASFTATVSSMTDEQQNNKSVNEEPDEEDLALKHAIVKCIFHALDMAKETGSSLNNFEGLLSFARQMFCLGKKIDEDDPDYKKIWPKTWEDAKRILMDLGYEDAKEYFVCLDSSHPNHWDIMDSERKMCRHCGEKGKIKYYYLGLNGKVKQWFSDPEMCEKMASHWMQKDHWMHDRNDSTHTKNEIWDGSRFAELSWFWNPEVEWLLPARCKTQGCNNIIGATSLEALPNQPDGKKEIYCDQCCTNFLHQPKYVKGDPRNIAYIGHWDGFQPFCSKCRSTGAIEVSIATMSKKDRLRTEEVYTVGFVPSYDLPDGRPNSIDPFLEPLIKDLEDGFIEGYKVEYAGSLLNPTSEPIDITIRHLLILWTGDHPAQCEVCKTKGAGGKKACRRCHICGVWLPDKNHNYYPGFRKQYRYPYQSRVLSDELPIINDIEEEERPTYFKSKSKENGYNGLSMFHRLHCLYDFNFLTDTVFDVMHQLPLNVVKNHIERLIKTGSLDEKALNRKLSKMPWTTDDCASRLPRNIEAKSSWKAEEFQKFAFPTSEFVLYGLLSENEYKVWTPIPRMVELVFNCGRNGWTDSMIQNFKRLVWRYCILFEEEYGIDACVINLHNLTHLSEDIQRFSSPDNYWCFDFERAVKRYVRQSSNKKHIEKSFARRESQREFMKFNKAMKQLPSLRSKTNIKVNREKVTASSLENARCLYLMNKNEDDVERIQSGVMTGASHLHILTDVERQTVVNYFNNVPSHMIDEVVESYKSVFLPLQCMPNGKLYRKGDIVYAKVGGNEVISQLKNFYLLEVGNDWKSIVIGSPFESILNTEHGDTPVRHPLSDNIIVQPTQHSICFAVKDILRQVMLFPDATLGLAVVDPMRENVPIPQVLVPVYPESGDFVSVHGDDSAWTAQVVNVNYKAKTIEAYFYVKHNNYIENKLWVKEKPSRKQFIHFDSILSVLEGRLIGTSWKEIDE